MQLNAEMLYAAVIHGCQNLVRARDALNAINVFPVADGDTGDNMAATAMSIIHHAKPTQELGITYQHIANASILGARGNSGMIFSQFFNGFLEAPITSQNLNTRDFASLIQTAAKSVRDAIVNPVEGTILTVMDAWAEALYQTSRKTNDFIKMLSEAGVEAEKALKKTASMLSVLKEAHVVDAGAQGFCHFIEGLYQYIRDPKPIELDDFGQNEPCIDHSHDEIMATGVAPTLRYCTEAVLEGTMLNKQAIGKLVSEYGDSVVVTGNQRLLRLHVHCDEPWSLFRGLQSFGKIRYPKVDDMRRQYEFIHERKSRIALVTDTAANIPQHFADEHQLHFIPINVHVNGHDLLDKFGINANTFYDELASLPTHPSTSCPNATQFEDRIRQAAEYYDDVVIISLAQILSATHDVIAKVAQKYANVHLINSKGVAGTQGLLVQHAAELIAEGASVEELQREIQDKIPKTKMYVVVSEFDSLIRSGRVSKLAGKIAQLAGLKPILTLDNDGKGAIFDKAFSEVKAIAKVLNAIAKLRDEHGGVCKYAIVHAGAPDKALDLAKQAEEVLKMQPEFIEPVTTSIGLHAGKGAVAIAVMFD